MNGYRVGNEFGKARISRISETKVTGFEDHLSEFAMKLETGPRRNQLVKVRRLTNTRNIDLPILLS